VLTITEMAIPPTLPRETDNGVVITRTGYTPAVKNALSGMGSDALLREPMLAPCR
jgi:hypothetical protein